MSEVKVRQIMIYRNGSDTPINLYDKSTIDDILFTQMIAKVFASPKISIINTSSGSIVLKPSRIDAIEIVENNEKYIINNLPLNENINDIDLIEGVTEEIDFDEEIDVEKITIENVTIDSGVENE